MRFTPERRRFAESVRAFCATACGTVGRRDVLTDGGGVADSPWLLSGFAGLGWLGVSLPAEYGGGGGFVDECILLEEASRGLAPITAYSTALTAAQTYLRWGTEEQKREIVTAMVRGELEAIALREPEVGSDLGGVRLIAVRERDEYVVNGRKSSTSAAHAAKHLLVLARTGPVQPKHEGLTPLMVPTGAAGLAIGEIPTTAPDAVNDVSFTDVRISVANVVGTAGRAWQQLMCGLSVERLIIATMSLGAAARSVDDVLAYIAQLEQSGRRIGSASAIRRRIADLALRSRTAARSSTTSLGESMRRRRTNWHARARWRNSNAPPSRSMRRWKPCR